jgi:flagellar FliL protein
MAEEKKAPEGAPPPEAKKPEATAEAAHPAPKASAAGGSPWLPVLVVIIILPILSFVVSDLVILPRIKRTLGDIAKVQQESAQPAAGGPLPTEHKEKKKGEKGKEGKEGKESGPAEVKFDNVVANLSGAMKSRFVKVSFTIAGESEEFKATIEASRARIIDTSLSILGALTVAELDEPGMKNIVRSDLINAMNQALGEPLVKELYFSEFVIQ